LNYDARNHELKKKKKPSYGLTVVGPVAQSV